MSRHLFKGARGQKMCTGRTIETFQPSDYQLVYFLISEDFFPPPNIYLI